MSDNPAMRCCPPQEAQKALGEAKRDIKQTSKELNQQLADMEESLATQLRRQGPLIPREIQKLIIPGS